MFIGESLIKWHDMNDTPEENWISTLVASKGNNGELIISLAYWDGKDRTFVDDNYPYKVSDVVCWAYLPKVDMQSAIY